MFIIPRKYLTSVEQIDDFVESETYTQIITFITYLSKAIRGNTTDSVNIKKCSAGIHYLLEMLNDVDLLIDEAPPIDTGSRFGNIAFRDWFDKLQSKALDLVENILKKQLDIKQSNESITKDVDTLEEGKPKTHINEELGEIKLISIPDQDTLHSASEEIALYLQAAFGDRTRIDYGSGHELSFLAFLYCLYRVGYFKDTEPKDIILVVFTRYLKLARRLQKTYNLEPAGSRGVWGLDDYQFLPFLFGASQLIGQNTITPSDILRYDVVKLSSDEYLYLDAIQCIIETKVGIPFGECSPILNDITAVPSWSKIYSGMVKMYQAEVLKKIPVMQHFLFGSILLPPKNLLKDSTNNETASST